MLIHKLAIGCIVGGLAATVMAESDVWVMLGTDHEGRLFSVNEHTFSVGKTKGGVEIAKQAWREDMPDGTIVYSQWYVIPRDCFRGEGQVVSLTLEGKYRNEYPFSYDWGGIYSTIAQVICRSYHLHRDADLKGL